MQIVTAADMGIADEDLWESPTAGTVNHLLSLLRAACCVDFGDGGALPFQQSDGPGAIGAEGAGIDNNRRHIRLSFSRKDIHRPNNPREGDCMHFCSPGLAKCTGAGFERGPRGEHIINHEDRFAIEAPGRFDRAGNVAAAL